MYLVADTSSETFHTIMANNVEEGSILVTDAYRSYNGLDTRFMHVPVKHEEGGYVVMIGNDKFNTNNLENWSIFKRGIIGIYHFVSVHT